MVVERFDDLNALLVQLQEARPSNKWLDDTGRQLQHERLGTMHGNWPDKPLIMEVSDE